MGAAKVVLPEERRDMTTTETAPTIVPDFGDDTPIGRKLAIISSEGNVDMAYPA
jgi:hypothetical protein